ncbi:MAG: hypothetical protein CMM02_18385 [Rhodopirellula sp.]|nr:hypothetical protein [Rhodopirellula sp.]MAT12968.1 hypothetical protein [Rhodopirellula sp.]|tara:strand:+ start:17094 stop:18299 length:1206 start_codon:yes stop_codon:yes gene_type:complete
MSGVAGAIVGSTVIGAGASMYAGSQQAKANRKNMKNNLARADAADALNYQRWLESRGSTGSAILPLYFREGEYSVDDINNMSDRELIRVARENGLLTDPVGSGVTERGGELFFEGPDAEINRGNIVRELTDKVARPFEVKAAKEAMNIYNMGKTPEELAGTFGGIQDRFRPAQASADDQILGIFSGAREDERLGDFNVLANERLNAAKLQSDRLKLEKAQGLNQLAAQNQRKGYVGSGFGSNLANLQLGQTIASKDATATALANLKNAQEKFQIQDQERDLRLQNVGQVGNQAARSMGFETADQRGLTDAFKDKLSITDPFKISSGPAPTKKPFESTATTPTGAIVGKGIADIAGTLGTAYASGALGNNSGGVDYGINPIDGSKITPDQAEVGPGFDFGSI